jgi:hypothetical protein
MTSKARKRSTAKPVPQYTWQGFIAYAESFGQAAVYVSNGIHLMHNAPVGALACHSRRSPRPSRCRRDGRRGRV